MAQKTIYCHHCGKEVLVSAKAFSVGCPHCNQRVNVEDFTFSSPFATARIETAGSVVVGPAGTLQARVKAKNVDLQGQLYGNVVAQDKIAISSEAKLCGDITADRLQVNLGAKINGFCRIEPKNTEKSPEITENGDHPACNP
jgi:hypothetical protein